MVTTERRKREERGEWGEWGRGREGERTSGADGVPTSSQSTLSRTGWGVDSVEPAFLQAFAPLGGERKELHGKPSGQPMWIGLRAPSALSRSDPSCASFPFPPLCNLSGAPLSIRYHVSTRLKPVLNWANVCSPTILRTVQRTMIRFLIQLLGC